MEIVEHENIVAIYEDVNAWLDGSANGKLREYAKNVNQEDVLYLSYPTKITISKEMIDDAMVASKLRDRASIIDLLYEYYDMKDDFALAEWENGTLVDSGFKKMANLLYNILYHPSDNLHVFIEIVESNLHPLVQRALIIHLTRLRKIKKLFITTRIDTLYEKIQQEELGV